MTSTSHPHVSCVRGRADDLVRRFHHATGETSEVFFAHHNRDVVADHQGREVKDRAVSNTRSISIPRIPPCPANEWKLAQNLGAGAWLRG
jgi:hypothetical protein